MCVNDLVVQGAEPLLFLDYFACGKLDIGTAAKVVEGIAAGCREANCALVGGETAEMPGMYAQGDYDLAGFSVGAVERGQILPRSDIVPGDVLIGLPSSGVHSNGYSLVRRLVADKHLAWNAPAPFAPQITVAEALLTPTRIYVRALLAAIKATGDAPGAVKTGAIKALAHITGGGLTENVPRVLPSDVAARIDLSSFTAPAVFGWLAAAGNISDAEMLKTFNCGIGMVLIAAKNDTPGVLAALRAGGESPLTIGEVIPGGGARSDAKGRGETWAVSYAERLALRKVKLGPQVRRLAELPTLFCCQWTRPKLAIDYKSAASSQPLKR